MLCIKYFSGADPGFRREGGGAVWINVKYKNVHSSAHAQYFFLFMAFRSDQSGGWGLTTRCPPPPPQGADIGFRKQSGGSRYKLLTTVKRHICVHLCNVFSLFMKFGGRRRTPPPPPGSTPATPMDLSQVFTHTTSVKENSQHCSAFNIGGRLIIITLEFECST